VAPLSQRDSSDERYSSFRASSPNDAAITRLVDAMLLEQNDEWPLNGRYMHREGLQQPSETAPARLSAVAR